MILLAQSTIQVFDIDSKAKVASLQIDFEVLFWNWLNENTLLMVSDSAVYRWDYEIADSIPIKWFDKSSSLNECQIINAEMDKSSRWCFVSGIYLKNEKIEGTIQLYSEEKKVSQIIEGHAANFFSLKSKVDDQVINYDIFAFSVRSKVTDMKLNLIQINSNSDGITNFVKKIIDLPLNEAPDNDFPIRVIFYYSLNLVFIYTKFGFVYVAEPQSGVCLMHKKYSESPIYLISPSLNSNEHFVLNREGDIFQAGVDLESFFRSCIEMGVEYYEPIGIFMNNLSIDQQARAYRDQFDNMKNSGLYLEALLLVAKSGKSFLRTFEYISSIKDFPPINETSALLEYFAIVLEDDKLNEVESLELVQLAVSKKKLDIVRKWLDSDQIFCTTQLGKVILESDIELALNIFKKANSEVMILHCLALLGNFDEFSQHLTASSSNINLKQLVNSLLKGKIELIPELFSVITEVKPSLIDEDNILDIFKPEFESISLSICEIISKHHEILARIQSQIINTRIAIQLVDSSDTNILPSFIAKCRDNGLELSTQEILPLLKNAELFVLAFSFETNLEECLELSSHLIGHEGEIKSTSLASSDVKKFIFDLIENNLKLFGKLCSKMGEFVDEKDFEEVKQLLKLNVDDESFCDFLTLWTRTSTAKEGLSDEILQSILCIGDEDRLLELCEKVQFSDFKSAFNRIAV